MIHSATNFTGRTFAQDPAAALGALASLVMWASPQADFVDVTGASIDKFDDRAGGAGYFSSASTVRPTLAAAQFGALSGATFDGVNDYSLFTGTWDRSAAWSIVTVMKASAGGLLASYSGTPITAVYLGTNAIILSHGSGFATLPYTYNTPELVIASSDGTIMSLRVGTSAAVPVRHDNNGGSAPVYMGAFNTGGAGQLAGTIGEMMMFSEDILDPENFDSLALVFDYVRTMYPAVSVPPV